ncbi:MAG: cardiolipin synthase [Phycisphaerae bacterium]|jgi:cardiolipin synthase
MDFLIGGVLVVNYLLAVPAVVAILRAPREPRAMLAWTLALLLLPVVGVVVFFLIGEPRLRRTRRRRRRRRQQLARSLSLKLEAVHAAHKARIPEQLEAGVSRLIYIATRVSAHHPTEGNAVTIYHDAGETCSAIVEAVESARHHVHMEYYIWNPDQTGRMMADLLIARARAGVQCRLLLDFLGCWSLTRKMVRDLRAGGVDVAFFMPVLPLNWRRRVNFRNHRKIAVVDGTVGFTGSQNVGDEYSGRRTRHGPWRDTHMRLLGPAVHDLQEVFVEDWNYATDEDLLADEYFPNIEPAGRQVVQVIPSGPDGHAQVMHQLLFAAVGAAERSVCVITPYFVPDAGIMLAFQSAAYRGVRVQIIIPSRNDQPVTLWVARSYYEELTRAGVEIYEYDHGMLHSKVVVADEAWALVGSANMDERSFRLNFELTTILYDAKLARELYADFAELRARSRRIKADDVRPWSFVESLKIGLARMASPLL